MSFNRIYGSIILVYVLIVRANNSDGEIVLVSNNSTIDDLLDQVFLPERNNIFDWNLFKVLNDKHEGNILLSPVSLKFALILLYEGSQGQTSTELTNAMQLSLNRSVIRDEFSNTLQSFKTGHPKYELNIGTRLYIDKIISVRQQYEAIVKNFYDVDVISVNLSDVHPIAESINAWVKNVTLGSIDRMIDDEKNLEGTLMMVLNTIFFKGTWVNNFSPNDTRIGHFQIDCENTVKVPYMTTAGRFYVSESPELDAKILRLPYQGEKYAMYVILPGAPDGLDRLIEKIDQLVVIRDKSVMQDIPVDVSIPKFKFQFTSHLKPALVKLGIEALFEDTATLTGIGTAKRSSTRNLRVSNVIQKNGIEMNELGTVAYAATEILVANKIEGESFRAKHPFLFYIEDESTGSILYIGKVNNPLEENGRL